MIKLCHRNIGTAIQGPYIREGLLLPGVTVLFLYAPHLPGMTLLPLLGSLQ